MERKEKSIINGRKIRDRRKALGLTQGDLAERVSLSLPTISKIENGEENVSLDTFRNICDVLGFNLEINERI